MALDGELTHPELARDAAVAEAARHEAQHLDLAPAEPAAF